MTHENSKVIGIIMTYNCADLVEETYARLNKDVFYKVIIVDDGSSDNIAAVATKLGLPFYSHPHGGYGENIKYGLRKMVELGGDYAVEIHGDGQFNPEYIPSAIAKITQGYDLVFGSRFTKLMQPLRDHMPLPRWLANIGLSFLERLVLQVPLSELHAGLRLYSKKLAETIPFDGTSADYLYSFEVIAQAKFFNLKIGEVPIRANYGKDHTSINYWKATVYSFQTFWVLLLYILARLGWKTKLFINRV